MKLSQEAVDDLLHIIEQRDRERGIPHDYLDLEEDLKSIEADVKDGQIHILSPKKGPI